MLRDGTNNNRLARFAYMPLLPAIIMSLSLDLIVGNAIAQRRGA